MILGLESKRLLNSEILTMAIIMIRNRIKHKVVEKLTEDPGSNPVKYNFQ